MEVLQHRIKSRGCSEVSLGDMLAVDDDRHRRVALLDACFADQGPHEGDRGEDDTLVWGHAQVGPAVNVLSGKVTKIDKSIYFTFLTCTSTLGLAVL